MADQIYFAIVVGTGFAGAVTACRLVEAGHKICIIERGRRYKAADFPRYPSEDLFETSANQQDTFRPLPDFSRWLWSRDHGLFDIKDLDDLISVQAAGWGGGSLIYANVHLRPPHKLFEHGWPEPYRWREGEPWILESYYDLAAQMLDVAPIPQRLAKTEQLKSAAGNVVSEAKWFRTPLAVNFTDQERGCDMRGRCCVGCDRGAKNTLDINYLARAEAGTPAPDIYTLAEVTNIEREGSHFKVTFKDLLRNVDVPVRAKYVFLCAGSLNTTRLLMDVLPAFGSRLSDDKRTTPLGSHYFPNADSIAAVFDCDAPQEPDYGPTITSAFLVEREVGGDFSTSLDFTRGSFEKPTGPQAGLEINGPSGGATLTHTPLLDWGSWTDGTATGSFVVGTAKASRFRVNDLITFKGGSAVARGEIVRHQHWFLVEDGGYPPDMEPLTGIFRSPLWLRRNRYIEFKGQTAKAPARRAGEEHLRLGGFGDSLAGTAMRGGTAGGFFDRSLSVGRFRGAELLATPVNRFFPPWLVEALQRDRKELLTEMSALALPFIDHLLNNFSKNIANQQTSSVLSQFFNKPVDDDKKEVLVRGMLRQALQVVAGGESAVASQVAEQILTPILSSTRATLSLLGDVLLWLLAYGKIDGRHTGILLTMGRDLYRGRLALIDEPRTAGKRLTAHLPDRSLDSSNATHEQVFRAIAATAWKGELRVNPGWTTLGRRVTVHSQGGCPMGEPDASVTDAYGQVHGCPGLYVMDAAAFPTSVGVNPSATITAVAEWKIEQFLCKAAGDPAVRASLEREAERRKSDATAWVVNRGRSTIDPLNYLPQSEDEGTLRDFGSLGLSFKEYMEGFVSAQNGPAATRIEALEAAVKAGVKSFVDAEQDGLRSGRQVKLFLAARTSDLGRLISQSCSAVPLSIRVGGFITWLDENNKSRTARLNRESTLQIFVRPSNDGGTPERQFHYVLRFGRGTEAGEIYGIKVLRNEQGLDLWTDTSTLYIHMVTGKRLYAGIVRVSIGDFLEKQLPSMNVTNTKDQARRSWALAAFYKYFAGELADVYVTRPGAVKEFFTKLLTEIHV
jgi:choline dehydrogenase-like flavoprotein